MKTEPVEKKPVNGKVGVLVAGHVDPDFLADGIVKALYNSGISSITVSKIPEVSALPYAAQNLSKSVDVVIAASFIPNDPTKSLTNAVSSSLLQLGVTGRTPIIPALPANDSLLEARALLPPAAEGWANAAVTILNLQNGGIETSPAVEPVVVPKPVLTPEVSEVDTLLEIFRESVKKHGARGIVGIGRKFRIVDDNGNGQIEFSEFTKAISEHALGWTPAQVKLVFDSFDSDKSGGISYEEFLIKIRGQLNERRKNLVLLAFQVLLAILSFIL